MTYLNTCKSSGYHVLNFAGRVSTALDVANLLRLSIFFSDALQNYCQQHGGHLIHVDSYRENQFIKTYLDGLKRLYKTRIQSSLDISKFWGVFFFKFKLPEVQINLHFG